MSRLQLQTRVNDNFYKNRFFASRLLRTAFALAMIATLAACSKPAEKAEDIRPVRAIVVKSGTAEAAMELSGEVRPRVESHLGFRVGGKIISRKVELGTVVKRGQILMQLDPQDLALAQAQAKAGLVAAESNRDLAQAELKRYQELRTKNFVAATVLDSKEVAFKTAQSSYEQALAAYKNQSNQTGYASLASDVDGVVTSVDAEVGQVVAAGTPVVRVAQAGDMEVVVGIPENKINVIGQMTSINVSLWANPNKLMSVKLRELSPIADPVTRTYTAKVTLPADATDVRLGMTATVSFIARNPNQVIKIPMTALLQNKESSSVWIVEQGAVKLVPVQIAGASGEDVLIAGGISGGQTVVTAGVNFLKPGQRVTLLGADLAAANDAAASVVGAAK
ncbi:efflux RND transporter periplasmic adaptor subunit [Undibacterium sp. Ji67W]|uniref:efflux RND transporter periplasmic adaptor subunit n=1 Tax=Undibacterium sp. Ji67W TaxID=3413042 RepID=UPI003BF1B624